MIIKAIRPVIFQNKVYKIGSVLEMPEVVGKEFISKKYAIESVKEFKETTEQIEDVKIDDAVETVETQEVVVKEVKKHGKQKK